MSRWRTAVRRELARFQDETGHDVLSRQEFLEQSVPTLRGEFPDNNHPEQKVSQILQQLETRGEVEFLSRGTYRIVDLDRGSESVSGELVGRRSSREDDSTRVRYTASEYETVVGARSVPSAFREAVLGRYGDVCPVSGIDHRRLLDIAHVLPWSEDKTWRTDPRNVLALSKTHHAAFDEGLFTLDTDDRLHVSPEFETESDHLRRTLLNQDGERLDLPTDALASDCVQRHNESLSWW
jgi:putative restriction endonuclease